MIGLFAGNKSDKVEGSISMTATIATIVFFLYVFAMLIPSISVGTRRLHDTGRSGWWMWLLLIPYIGWLVLFIFFVLNSEWGSNKYGDNPKGMENNTNSPTKPLSKSHNDLYGLDSVWYSNKYGDNSKGMENNANSQTKPLSKSHNDLYGLMPEDFGKPLDEALFFEWKESVKKLNKSMWIQAGWFFLGILPGILYAIIVRRKIDKKILNLQIRLGITYSDVKQARINCKNRKKMRKL